MKKENLHECTIVHSINGRVRIKSVAFKYLDAILKSKIETQLSRVKFIKSVEISIITGNVLIYFDNNHLTIQNLINLLQNTINSYLFEIIKKAKIDKSSKYVIERKLQEETPKEILQKMTATLSLLVYNIFFKKRNQDLV